MIRRLCAMWRTAALQHILEIRGLMRLLMKPRNSQKPWTTEEKAQIIVHLKEISKTIPLLALFCLPGGSLLLPIFASLLDRRRAQRMKPDPVGLDEAKRPPLSSGES